MRAVWKFTLMRYPQADLKCIVRKIMSFREEPAVFARQSYENKANRQQETRNAVKPP